MLRAFVFGFGAVLAYGLWNQSQAVNGYGGLLAVGFIAALVLAYYAGRRRSRGSSVAVASATAISEATAVADARQAVVVNVAVGAREVAQARYGGLDQVEWIGPPEVEIEEGIIEDGGLLDDVVDPPAITVERAG